MFDDFTATNVGTFQLGLLFRRASMPQVLTIWGASNRRVVFLIGLFLFLLAWDLPGCSVQSSHSVQHSDPASSRVISKGCIAGGDEKVVNAALSEPNSRALLCPRAVFEINEPIMLSADGQELATAGSPSEKDRAVIYVAGRDLATAISSRSSHIKIHDLTVAGERPKFGRIPKGGALIEVGGAVTGIVIDHVRAYEPRGWSVLHVFEGAKNCSGAKITNNFIGPAGAPNGQWADGISFACRNGLISHNTVIDASDGAIVIFGAPGTLVEQNIIETRANELLGAINLVDYKPYDGDYRGVVVRGNQILATSGYIKVGIAVGPAVWGSSSGMVNRGGKITDNTISGDAIGFGIAVDGARDVTITGNRLLGHPHGEVGARCIKGQSPPGKGFIRNLVTSDGVFQNDFQYGALQYAICIDKE